jgi:hypothetical protein
VQSIFDDYDDPEASDLGLGCEEFSCGREEIVKAIFQGNLIYYEVGSTPTMPVSSIDMASLQRQDNCFVSSQVVIQGSAANPVPRATVAHRFILPDGSTFMTMYHMR